MTVDGHTVSLFVRTTAPTSAHVRYFRAPEAPVSAPRRRSAPTAVRVVVNVFGKFGKIGKCGARGPEHLKMQYVRKCGTSTDTLYLKMRYSRINREIRLNLKFGKFRQGLPRTFNCNSNCPTPASSPAAICKRTSQGIFWDTVATYSIADLQSLTTSTRTVLVLVLVRVRVRVTSTSTTSRLSYLL